MAAGNILQRYQEYVASVAANYPGAAPTKNFEALDQLAELANYGSDQLVYVDASNGSDATGTGDVLRPYSTIEAALADIVLRPAGNYTVMLGPGAYGVGSIAWPVAAGKNISAVGVGANSSISVPVTYTALGGVVEESIIFANLGVNDLTVDLSAAAGKVAQILCFNCSVGVDRVDTLPPGPQIVRLFNCLLVEVETSATMLMLGCQYVGGAITVNGPSGQLLAQGCLLAGVTGGPAITVDGTLYAAACNFAFSDLTGTGTLAADASSLSPTSPPLSNTVATQVSLDTAAFVGYTPAVPANWSPVPTEVKGALDQLAANATSATSPLTNIFYVDSTTGSDVDGNGSIGKPFATIQKAATEIGAAASNAEFNDATARYYVVKVSPGVYAESPTFGTRPYIQLDLDSAQIVGNLTIQFDQGGISGAGLQSPHFVINGKTVRGLAGGVAVIGVTGDVIYESIGGGSSLVAQLEVFRCAIQGDIIQQLGGGGGTFTLTNFVSSAIVSGTIQNNSGAGSHTLYVDNCDDSSSNSIGAVNGVVNLNVLSNARFTGIVDISGSQSGAWRDVRFASVANDFTGCTGTISMDANSYQSYFANVPTKGAEVASLVDNSRGVAYSPANPGDWSVVPVDAGSALDELAARTSGGTVIEAIGVATLVAGAVAVAYPSITAGHKVFCQRLVTTAGTIAVTINAGVGFTINSGNGSDTADIQWMILAP